MCVVIIGHFYYSQLHVVVVYILQRLVLYTRLATPVAVHVHVDTYVWSG